MRMKKSGGKKKSAMRKKKTTTMKRKMKRVSKVARGKQSKTVVFRGNKEKTSGGLRKNDLIKNKRGKVVSRKQSEQKKKLHGKRFTKWGTAVVRARK